jgi:3',5'-cyclic AMP phosphodiesterase CpdA
MKIWMLSDLHIRIAAARAYSSPLPGIPDADICVLAGDVTDGMAIGIEWIGEIIARHMPVVFVLGNHDLFAEDMENAVRRARRAASN